MKLRSLVQTSWLLAAGLVAAPYMLPAQDVTTENVSESTTAVSKEELEEAVGKVKPSLVRIKVVEPNYYDGRESKFVSFGSGTIISPDGYIVTNHHVAGKAVFLEVTMPNREKIPAELIGTDPATDIAVIKLRPEQPTTFPHAEFGDSDKVKVGDAVLALGSPMALSQSVTLGIVANTEMIMPESYGDYTFTLDGENVGELVRWIGHDAAIFPGNSGGPLIDLEGKIIGVNEIGMALGGAIPGNLAKQVVDQIIKNGSVKRGYIGTSFQPLLRNSEKREGVLINTVLKDSPAEKAGVKPGDVLLSINGTNIQGRFAEDLPGINQLVANLQIGQEASLDILRDGQRQTIKVSPELRKPAFIPETELREWGAAMRDVSMWTALELAREESHGVLVTSMRSGGPLAKAKPELREGDIIEKVNGESIKDVKQLVTLTEKLMGGRKEGFSTVLVTFEREGEELLSVVEVGIDRLQPPGAEVAKGWLPLETQVVTRELAKQMKLGDIKGVRVSRVYSSAPEGFPIKVGDIITAIDGVPLEASRNEDADLFEQTIRQYRAGKDVEFSIQRDGAQQTVAVKTEASPATAREMKRYRDLDFEFVVRKATFNDREKPTLQGVKFEVVVEGVTSGGWASLAGLQVGDALLQIDGQEVNSVEDVEKMMEKARTEKAESVVFFVRRNAQNVFLELESSWKTPQETATLTGKAK